MWKSNLLKWLFILTLLYPLGLNAQAFNFEEKIKQLDLIEEQLDDTSKTAKTISGEIKLINQILDQTKTCVEDSTQLIKRINEVIETVPKALTAQGGNENYAYLQKQKDFHQNALAQCKLTEFRAQELLKKTKNTLHLLTATKVLTKKVNLISQIQELNSKELYTQLYQSLGTVLNIQSITYTYLSLVIFLAFLHFICLQLFSLPKNTILHFLPMTLFFGALSGYNIFFRGAYHVNILDVIVYTVFVYATVQVLTRLVSIVLSGLSLEKIQSGYLQYHDKTNLYATLISLMFFIFYIFYLNDVALGIKGLIHCFVFSFVGLLTAYMFRNSISHNKTAIRHLAKMAFITGITAFITLEIAGFHQLNEYLLAIFAATLFILIAIKVLFFLTGVLIDYQARLVQAASVDKEVFEMKFTELRITRYSLYLIIIAVGLLSLARVWQVPPNFIFSVESTFIEGFSIYNITIIPLRIILAIILYSILQYAVKYSLCVIYLKKGDDEDDDGIPDVKHNVTMFSIFYYLGMIVNILIALAISGINFTSLAIIAGALSVGIGLGLQGIVNNFISGFILLIEKPIKPGDRISIEGKEGFVKKVNFRATQVTTIFKEDLIVPNYELISKTVTNFVFRNSQASIACDVGVAYNSDTTLVRDTLMEVALSHPEVSKSKRNYPTIYFKSFGDSALEFCLWVTIIDVNKKYRVKSELNFAINKAFNEKGITIAYPQLDIHMDPQEVQT